MDAAVYRCSSFAASLLKPRSGTMRSNCFSYPDSTQPLPLFKSNQFSDGFSIDLDSGVQVVQRLS